MMQTQARSSRRRKVTVRWLPVELIIEIFRAVQKLIGRRDFKLGWYTSMALEQEYHNNLLAFALSSKEWTAIAQAELFKNLILGNRRKTGRLLELVRDKKGFRNRAENAISIRFGEDTEVLYQATGSDNDLNKIALCCPNVVEISCYRVDVKLEYFRNMKKLDNLNVVFGSILPPATSVAPSQPVTLPVTLLSLVDVTIPSPLDPSSPPLVRSLQLNQETRPSIRLLLPQLSSLRIECMGNITDLNLSIQESTSITSLCISEVAIPILDDASKTVVMEKIIELTVKATPYGVVDSSLASIISGSKAMKKVILDGVNLFVAEQVEPKLLKTLKVLKEACKKKGIELWKENFEVGNGKVDLEK